MDITYITMARRLVYLAAIIDWHSRKVLAWDVSISMEADFCVRVLEAALARHGTPEIFNTDQGSQFTSLAFTERLKTASIAISMDGRGCWRDNVFVERLWRSVKYEEVYLRAYETVSQAREGIARYLIYNTARPHTAYGGTTPDSAYYAALRRCEKQPDRAAQCAANMGCPARRSCVRRKRRPPAAVHNPAPQSTRQSSTYRRPIRVQTDGGQLCAAANAGQR